MVAKFFTSLVSPVTNYLGKRNDNKTKVITQKVQRVMDSDNKNAELQLILAEGMQYSWKDEYWTIVLSLALIGCFIPAVAPHIEEGFKILETMPEFYQYWLGVCVLTSFGMRLKR